MTTATKFVTAEELFAAGDIGRCELIRGETVRMAPASFEHGDIAASLLQAIRAYVHEKRLGKVLAAETGFIVGRDPDTVRAPDVAFVRTDRLPKGRLAGFFGGAPDLAVEVNSPSDRWSEVSAKVEQWLAAGARSVWVVDPPTRSIEVYAANGSVRRYRVGDQLRDEDGLPGFELPVASVFEAI